MKREYVYYVYIMSSYTKVIYTGITNDLFRRVLEHKRKIQKKSFTSKYNVIKLVFFEQWGDASSAIAREKQIKGWKRIKKLNLIEKENPKWEDLSHDWYDGNEELPYE